MKINPPYANRIMNNETYPPLPVVKHLLDVFRLPMTLHLHRDWHALFPIHLIKRNPALEQHPLARSLYTMIYSLHVHATRFYRERMLHSYSEKTCMAYMNRLHSEDPEEKTPWSFIENCMLALGLTDKDFQWRWIEELFKNGDDGAAAYQAMKKYAESQRKKIHLNHNTLPGITSHDMGVPWRPYREK